MARMFPERLPADVSSGAERRLFEDFRLKFSDDFVVFHGVTWLARHGGRAKDGEADFVIAHPRYGVLIIEVKGGGISREGDAYFSTDTSRRKNRIKDPFKQAKRAKDALWDKLRESDLTRGFNWALGHAVAFPDVYVEGDLALDAPREIVIDAARTQDLKQAVIDIFRHYGMDKAPVGEEAVEALCGLLHRSWQIEAPLGTEVESQERIIRTLTEQQFHVLDMLRSHRRVLVSGCAGSGKTMLAMEKARRLAAEGYSVLLTCFNRNLETWLQGQMAAVPGVTVHRFLSLCATLCDQAGSPISRRDDETDKQFYDRFPDALMGVLDRLETRYDAVIVDEGQDFSAEMWAALTSLLRDENDGILYIFYDANQRLYRPEGEFPISDPPFHLNHNCRNTRRIHEATSLFYTADLPSQCIGPEGRTPHALLRDEGESERQSVVNHIRHLIDVEKVQPGHIVVLTRRARERSVFEKPPCGPNWSATWDFKDCAGQVLFSTIHAFKGLERPVVIVCELEGVDPESEAELLYVAFSRAREHLVVAGADRLFKA